MHLLFIDDYGHAEFYCADLVLNQNIYAQEELYKERDLRTELLLGSLFVLLRREFWSWRGWQRKNPEIARKILVTLGGSDPDNVTLKILELAAKTNRSWSRSGSSGRRRQCSLCPHWRRHRKSPKSPIRLVRNAANMPELMAWADMAIISGGTTSYETAFMGLPSLIVIIAENQVQVAEKLAENGVAVNLGWHHDLSCACIQKMVEDLTVNCNARDAMSRIGRQLVDGQGTTRVIKAMLERIITVREAVESDCEQIFEWANDDDTRAASFSSGLIDWDTHRNWFSGKTSGSKLLIADLQR